MGSFLQSLANFQNKKSISFRLRAKRMKLLEKYVKDCFGDEQEIEILDMGGTQAFWKALPTPITNRAKITLVNLSKEKVTEFNFRAIVGDACSLHQFEDKRFDLVFSNSVIEHVGNYEDQKRMAGEIERLGKKHFIQTPNRNFPIEPHFLFPFFQYLPLCIQIFFVTHW
jgi:ubiquinone/menaquinone biosynthesis C-methylase UbiE